MDSEGQPCWQSQCMQDCKLGLVSTSKHKTNQSHWHASSQSSKSRFQTPNYSRSLIASDLFYATTDNTPRMSSTPASPRKSQKFKYNRKKDHKNAPSTYNFPGLAMCSSNLKINQICYNAVVPSSYALYSKPRKSLPAICEDLVPTTHQSMVIYQYMCHCDCQYLGQTSLRFQDSINQHILKSIRNNRKPIKILPKRNCKEKINRPKSPECDSAIGLHLKAMYFSHGKMVVFNPFSYLHVSISLWS